MHIHILLPRRLFGKKYVMLLVNPNGKRMKITQLLLKELPRLNEIFDTIESWTMTKTKFEVMDICNPLDIPVGPILSLKELAEDQGLRDTNTIVEVDHPERGKYLTVGNPIKLSDSPAKVERSPLLGEHTDEILKEFCQMSDDEIKAVREAGAV